MIFTTGTKLGPYEILSAIGAGGQGEVYKARDRQPSGPRSTEPVDRPVENVLFDLIDSCQVEAYEHLAPFQVNGVTC